MAAVDKFATYAPSPDSGFVGCAAVTPDDNADLAYVTDGLRSDSGGAVAVIFADGSTGTVSPPGAASIGAMGGSTGSPR